MKKFRLIKPSIDYIDEIESYRNEVMQNGAEFNGDSGLREFEDIKAWIEQCKLMENKETTPNPTWVEAEQFMLVCGEDKYILGMINFRHYLNEYLAEYAGHIGYGVRPSARRKGYAKEMLHLCLDECKKRKLNKVLITCNAENIASKKTILACGGGYDRTTNNDGEVVERYFIFISH